MPYSFRLLFALLFLISTSVRANQTLRSAVNLLDYIAKDYALAVADGQVIDTFEFEEIKGFSTQTVLLLKALSDPALALASGAEIDAAMHLASLVSEKASPTQVAAAADALKLQLLASGALPQSPLHWPSLNRGQKIYEANCAGCHGNRGDGNGPQAAGLNPSPTAFADATIMRGVAPFQAFNTAKLGVEGTSMRAFTELSDKQLWDVAFYITSLQHRHGSASVTETALVPLADLASLSDEELEARFEGFNTAAARLNADTTAAQQPLVLASLLLTYCSEAMAAGQWDVARDLALQVYLQGIEPVEPVLKANDAELTVSLEEASLKLRTQLARQNAAEGAATIKQLQQLIHQATDVLADREHGTWSAAAVSFTIVLREGLEAFFIILAMVAALRSLGATAALRFVHGGWLAALFTGMVCWFFTSALLQWSAAGREVMEGALALFAVGVLLYIGYWLHGKSNAERWKQFVGVQLAGLAKADRLWSIGVFAFVVVFREAIESVLFLSTLSAGGGGSHAGVAVGAGGAALLLAAFAYGADKWTRRMPIAQVFKVSTWVVLVLAVVLAGKGIHALQESGALGVTTLPLVPRFDWLGIYPSLETLGAQAVVAALVALLLRLSK